MDKHKLLSLLSTFRDLGYKILYFIPREIDVPLVARDDDIVVGMPLIQLILSPPDRTFTLYLEHQSRVINDLASKVKNCE